MRLLLLTVRRAGEAATEGVRPLLKRRVTPQPAAGKLGRWQGECLSALNVGSQYRASTLESFEMLPFLSVR